MSTRRTHRLYADPVTAWRSARRVLVLAIASVSLSGCFMFEDPYYYEPPPTVIVTSPPPVPVHVPAPAPVVFSGDLMLRYDLGGWSCWDLDLFEIEYDIYDHRGWLVAEDWGLPCNAGGGFLFRDLPLGSYRVTLTARDDWGVATYWFDGWVQHDSGYTQAWLTLY